MFFGLNDDISLNITPISYKNTPRHYSIIYGDFVINCSFPNENRILVQILNNLLIQNKDVCVEYLNSTFDQLALVYFPIIIHHCKELWYYRRNLTEKQREFIKYELEKKYIALDMTIPLYYGLKEQDFRDVVSYKKEYILKNNAKKGEKDE